MIGLDTNILVRLLTNDDKKQAKFAADLIAKHPVFIPKSVMLETEWVLRYTYDITADDTYKAFTNLLGLAHVSVEDPVCISQALDWYKQGFDFADALHLASSHKTESFATFDKKLISKAKKLNIKFIST